MILGTAGHIDHGKTALVRALTGVDTDRLPEEKRRGITIDLGFAPLRLDGLDTIGVIDVPGHEAFVRTMVAGATGVDLALLVIAADEGVMPQTREHLAILRLLGVRAGVVALTKSDLVEEEWLALVRDDVRVALVGSSLDDAEIIAVSAVSGAGIDELRAALLRAAHTVPARASDDLFRMPVDRAFTIRGTGTVATGTVWSGSLARDEVLRLYPSGEMVRVRALQAHGHGVERVSAGERAAVALAGVELARVGRGAVLVSGDAWRPSTVIRADVALLDDVDRTVGPRSRLRLHLGTSEVGARVVPLAGALAPGASRAVRVVVEEPIVTRAGDRFVLRGGSPLGTVGGGIVTDPLAPRRARALALDSADPVASLDQFLLEAGVAGIGLAELPVRLGVSRTTLGSLLRAPERWRAGDRVFSAAAREVITRQLLAALGAHHRDNPLASGAPRQWLRSRVRAPDAAIESLVEVMLRDGRIVAEQGEVRLAEFAPRLSERQRTLATDLVARIGTAGVEPPSLDELAAAMACSPTELSAICRMLAREGTLVAVESNRHYSPESVAELTRRLGAGMVSDADYGPAELREFLGLTRKFLIPFLEYCDREAYTVRNDAGRRRRGTKMALP
jgi:selenocysteine-specific elongation factor